MTESETVVDPPIPLWQKVVAGVWLLAWAVFIGFDTSRFVSDFWPIDRSTIGPNLVASLAQYSLLAITLILLWPPTRRRVHRFVDKKVETVKAHIDGHVRVLHDRHDSHESEIAALHEKLDHIIRHSSEIPDFPPRP